MYRYELLNMNARIKSNFDIRICYEQSGEKGLKHILEDLEKMSREVASAYHSDFDKAWNCGCDQQRELQTVSELYEMVRNNISAAERKCNHYLSFCKF